MKVVIIGGVAGGASAAARLRRLDEQAQIIIFERSGYMSYANCGLPYYVGDVITDPGELTLQTPESFWQRFRVDVRVNHEVRSIIPGRKVVTVCDLNNHTEFEESYDKLIISSGAMPVKPALPGIDDDRLFTLRTVEDALRIHGFVKQEHPQSAVVVGGGFIGLEMAENLRKRGLAVTIVERMEQLFTPFDPDMASFVHAQFRTNGVNLVLGASVIGFQRDGAQVLTMLEERDALRSDMVVLAIGVTPDTALAKAAGLELGIRDSIVVSQRMETSDPNIYAVGDAVQVRHFITRENTLISLAGPANKQGRIAADNICGRNSIYNGSQGSSVLALFDMTAASTGLNERAAKAAALDYDKVVLSPGSHAGYYPGAEVMTMKVLFEKNTLRLLGAQIIGCGGVDKRIDVLATALRAGLTADQLKELDLAYAPPYSSAKDPVNMAGFMVENIAAGVVKQIHWTDLEHLAQDGSITLLDVRTREEYAGGCADGFVNIPVDELRERLSELPQGKPVWVMCQSALRSYIGCRILTQHGFDCFNFSGGYRFYSSIVKERQAAKAAYPCGMDR